ncbi:hypothetical protein Aph01nite_43130 [Acrocarpospora phusangensis]|uniref:Uncharacterized protein n=1 Tax=Acrocarpospora phusangensis TaxID=1070424 RepID=A0A919QC79_9ACTN|nr:hypothetical protein [Acrocarpospora phusangensis]GIH26003.1 hypothetical protein Aph01nite_43130 [Acrocarpospora phusangensis]
MAETMTSPTELRERLTLLTALTADLAPDAHRPLIHSLNMLVDIAAQLPVAALDLSDYTATRADAMIYVQSMETARLAGEPFQEYGGELQGRLALLAGILGRALDTAEPPQEDAPASGPCIGCGTRDGVAQHLNEPDQPDKVVWRCDDCDPCTCRKGDQHLCPVHTYPVEDVPERWPMSTQTSMPAALAVRVATLLDGAKVKDCEPVITVPESRPHALVTCLLDEFWHAMPYTTQDQLTHQALQHWGLALHAAGLGVDVWSGNGRGYEALIVADCEDIEAEGAWAAKVLFEQNPGGGR